MRIAILAWGLPPSGSGLGRAAAEIAQSLQSCGCDVVVFDANRTAGMVYAYAGLSIVGCAPPTGGSAEFLRKRAMIGHLIAPWYFRRAVIAEHRKTPFDIIEATNWYAPAALLTGGGITVVIRNSTPAVDAGPQTVGLRNRVDLWFAHQLEKRTVRQADALISNTPSHADLVTRLYDIESAALHRVISLALHPAVLKRGAASGSPSARDCRTLLFVGRAERRKGFEEMLSGFLIANAAHRGSGQAPLRLTIVGVDPSQVASHLEAGHPVSAEEPDIRILNGLSDEDLHAQYEKSAIVIAPSRYESFGLVYREAAAFRRPLIACAEDPAAVDFVAEACCGVLAATCSAEAIADAILRLAGAPEMCDALGTAGRKHVQTLTAEHLAKQTLQVYRCALSATARGSKPLPET